MLAVALLAAVLAATSLCVGALATSPAETLHILLDGYSSPPTAAETAILHYRVPRTVVIALVGASLGLAGGLIQGHTRNPLTDPGLLGISAGAALAVVCGIYFFGQAAPVPRTVLALVGAGLAAVAVFALGGTGRRASDPVSLVIAGAAVTALLTAMTTTIVLRGDLNTLDAFRFWTAGSVAISDLAVVIPVLGVLAVGAIIGFGSAPSLNLLDMGDQSASSLGMNVARTRILGILAITLLAGGATAVAGPLAFLGLLAPHIARALVGTDYRWVLPTAALSAVGLLYVADIAGRIVADQEVPAGIMLIIIGVPFFLLAIRRTRFATT